MTEQAKTVDITDPDYQLHAKVFNAITLHPDVDFLFSRRLAVADRVVDYIWREVARERRRRRLRRWWWDIRYGRR